MGVRAPRVGVELRWRPRREHVHRGRWSQLAASGSALISHLPSCPLGTLLLHTSLLKELLFKQLCVCLRQRPQSVGYFIRKKPGLNFLTVKVCSDPFPPGSL